MYWYLRESQSSFSHWTSWTDPEYCPAKISPVVAKLGFLTIIIWLYMIEVVLLLFRLSFYLGCPIIPVVLLLLFWKLFIWKRRCSKWTMQRLLAIIHALIALNKYWLLVNLGFKLPLFYCLWFWFHLNSF